MKIILKTNIGLVHVSFTIAQRLNPWLMMLSAPVLGLAEGGTWVKAPLLVNMFVNGRSRAGKSNELSVLLAAITAWLREHPVSSRRKPPPRPRAQ